MRNNARNFSDTGAAHIRVHLLDQRHALLQLCGGGRRCEPRQNRQSFRPDT